jgi:hypothetical protein
VFFKKTMTATMVITFFRAHKRVISRVITYSLVALCAFWLSPSWSEAGPFYFVIAFVLFVMLVGGQFFWVGRVVTLGERFIPGKPRRAWVTVFARVVWLFFFVYNLGPTSFPGTYLWAIRRI